jgi:hypothetical protein
MSWGFRKSFGLGRVLRLNLSKRGPSLSAKLGPISTNTPTRRLRISLPFGGWWQSRRIDRP